MFSTIKGRVLHHKMALRARPSSTLRRKVLYVCKLQKVPFFCGIYAKSTCHEQRGCLQGANRPECSCRRMSCNGTAQWGAQPIQAAATGRPAGT
ncbi:unknown [Prevotella sp. CAG:1058]|nr:unknown [Prevotella sp. CAG:1058]